MEDSTQFSKSCWAPGPHFLNSWRKPWEYSASVDATYRHSCWCPGPLHCQHISSHDIDFVKHVASFLPHKFTASAKFAGPRPQAGNRGGGLANKAFADPAGLAIICENWFLMLTHTIDLQFKYLCRSSGLHGLHSFRGHWDHINVFQQWWGITWHIIFSRLEVPSTKDIENELI